MNTLMLCMCTHGQYAWGLLLGWSGRLRARVGVTVTKTIREAQHLVS